MTTNTPEWARAKTATLHDGSSCGFKLGDRVSIDSGHAKGDDWTGVIVLHKGILHVKYDDDGDLVALHTIRGECEVIKSK